jgi:hypothetical protein
MIRGRALVLVLAAGVSACSLFHRNRPTPQQELFEALNRGNGAQASQLWLEMSPEDRIKFNRGQGITPAIPPQQVVKMLSEIPPDQMEGQISIKPPAAGGSLLDLPALMAHPPGGAAPAGSGAPSPTAPSPQQEPEHQP